MELSREAFEAIVEKVLAELPYRYLKLLDNVAIMVEDEPTQEDLAAVNHQPGSELLGLYQGVALPERGAFYANAIPDRVVLFRGPLLRRAHTLAELEQEIAATLVHELGHYFGLKEHQLP